MESALIHQFLDLFQDFLNLCQLDDWPSNDTTEAEIKNAFLVSQHIEKCLDKLQRRNIINEFLAVINSNNDISNVFLKNSFTDPPKYVLKKIINSKTKITQMDTGFKVFLQLFNEQRLEDCLTDFMLEAASKETLLRNLSTEISKDKLIEFKSYILLNELNSCEEPKEPLIKMLQKDNCKQETIDLLVVSLLNKELKFHDAVNNIINAIMNVMLKRNHAFKTFWKYLFQVDNKYFIRMCLDNADLCKMIINALLDSGKLLKENMSAEFFYVDLTYSELVSIVNRICKDSCLKLEFEDIMRENNCDCEFWEKIMTSC